jgi:hypothetical protein
MNVMRSFWPGLVLLFWVIAALAQEAKPKQSKEISYYRDVRPILQLRCQGCHQPAKQKVTT